MKSVETIVLYVLGVALVLWLISNFKEIFNGAGTPAEELAKKASDALGGAGYPGSAEYVSPVENLDRWKNILFGSASDNAFKNDPEQWKVFVSPQVATGMGPDGYPIAWADYFSTPQEILAAKQMQGTIDPGPIVSSVEDWMRRNRVF